jgi:hypothetical protein
MKKLLLPVAAMVAVGAVACADQPTMVAPDAYLASGAPDAPAPTVIVTNPLDDLFVTSFPYSQDISATVTREWTDASSHQHLNLCGVHSFKLFVSDGTTREEIQVADYEGGNLADPVRIDGEWTCEAINRDFDAVWLINEPGVYTIYASAVTDQGDKEEEVSIELEVFLQTIIVSYPAAPSVAADLLKIAGIPARYGSGRTGGNHISDVAAEMNRSVGTDFNGVAKSEVASYRCAVADFLMSKPIAADVGDIGCRTGD